MYVVLYSQCVHNNLFHPILLFCKAYKTVARFKFSCNTNTFSSQFIRFIHCSCRTISKVMRMNEFVFDSVAFRPLRKAVRMLQTHHRSPIRTITIYPYLYIAINESTRLRDSISLKFTPNQHTQIQTPHALHKYHLSNVISPELERNEF